MFAKPVRTVGMNRGSRLYFSLYETVLVFSVRWSSVVPPHLRRDVSSVIQVVWPPRVAVLFQFGRALLRNQRALSGKPRSSGNPTDVRPRVAGLVVSQALWICSLRVGRPRSTADLQLDEHFPPPVQLNSIPPDRRNGTLPTELAE